MTKARTKAQKRRGRPRKEDVEREPNGRIRRSISPRENPQAVVLAARARILAAEAGRDLPVCDDELRRIAIKNAAALSAPWLTHPAGRAMASEPDIIELWGVVCDLLNAEAAYLAAIDAPRLRGASMGDAPPPGEEVASVRMLTAEEASHAAVARWRRVLRAMADSGYRSEIEAAVFEGRPGPRVSEAIRAFAIARAKGERDG